MNNFEWADADSIEQAVQLTVEGSVFKAGGIDLLDLLKERLIAPKRLVNIDRIPGLDQISDGAEGLRIGPLVTLAQLAASDVIRKRYPALAQAAGDAATPQIRNMATIGGNLLQRPRCWYFRSEQFPCRKKGGEKCFAQDGENQYHAIFNNGLCAIVHPSATATPLVAMHAQLEITRGSEKRTEKLEDFLTLPNVDLHRENKLQPGELVTQIIIPAPRANTRSLYIKQGEKESFDWPIAEVAVVLEMEGARCKQASVVLGAAAPVPHRANDAEAALAGKAIDESAAKSAADAAMNGATPLAHNAYKVPLFKAVIARAILSAAKGAA